MKLKLKNPLKSNESVYARLRGDSMVVQSPPKLDPILEPTKKKVPAVKHAPINFNIKEPDEP